MNEQNIFWLCLVVAVIGIAAIVGIIFFGIFLFRDSAQSWFESRVLEHLYNHGQQSGQRSNLPRYFADLFSEVLERRNEFWTSYGQIVVAALIIIVLTILLLTKTISAEAGLPILSAISGFAIAKGVTTGRSSSGGPDNQG
jgi:uncharacterized membrane protein